MNLINELRMLAEDLYSAGGHNRYATAMSKAADELAKWEAVFSHLPGAQNVPEKLCYDSRWEISIDYVDGWNAAIDAVRGKSPSWYCPDCCIVFPFGEPKSCPHDDARCNRALTAAPKVEGK